MSEKRQRLHVISNTHWDREWRYSLWRNRQMLVELVDRLIELMEQHPEYRHYILDGQSVVVQDYLEIRPENRARLVALVRSGRIQVGPWYTLPHEFAVTGESLVRNLQTGIRCAEEYGRACRVGYTIFSFGQVSQLPQIYAGFGIDRIMVCKRVSRERAPQCEFLWESPDGTRALATRYGDHGRGNYFYFMFIPALFGMGLWDPKEPRVNPLWVYDYGQGGRPCHLIDGDLCYQDTFLLDSPHGWHPDRIPQGLEDCAHTVRDSSVRSPRLYSESADFCNPTLNTVRIIAEGNRHLRDAELVHSSVEDFMEELSAAVDRSKLAVVRGELRDGPGSHVQANVHSAALPIRMANYEAERNLIGVAEPLACLAATAGAEYPARMLGCAWEYLLKAHPHDSINGLGHRRVWFNTLDRLAQVQDIAETVTTAAIQNIVRQLDTRAEADGAILVTAFNTLPHPRDAGVEISLDLPAVRPVEDFRILDAQGGAVPCQVIGRTMKRNAVVSTINRPLPYEAQRLRVRARFTDLPACGYRTYRVEYLCGASVPPANARDNRQAGTRFTGPATMENEHLRVTVNADGTLDLARKESGQVYRGLLYFEDRGNVGMCHTRQYPLHDETITSHDTPAQIAVIEEGPSSCAIRVGKKLAVPADVDEQTGTRTGTKVDLGLEYVIRLAAGSRWVEVDLAVENNARNHITRIIFPTGLQTDLTHADAPFDVDTRRLAPRSPENPADETMDEQPCYSFVDMHDEREGLAILTGGLPSYELLPRADRPLALVVARGTECRVDAGEAVLNHYPQWDHAQMLGRHAYRLALYPHAGGWEAAQVPAAAAEFNTPVHVAQHGKGAGVLPREKSWIRVEPRALSFSALKKAESSENLILRLFNPTPAQASATIDLGDTHREAWLCDLNEERRERLPLAEGRRFQMDVPAKKVVTVELVR